MSLLRAGSGNSMSRALMAVLVVGVTWAVVDRKREWTIPMATAVASLGTTLAGVWGIGKWRANAPQSSQGQGAPDQEVPK